MKKSREFYSKSGKKSREFYSKSGKKSREFYSDSGKKSREFSNYNVPKYATKSSKKRKQNNLNQSHVHFLIELVIIKILFLKNEFLIISDYKKLNIFCFLFSNS